MSQDRRQDVEIVKHDPSGAGAGAGVEGVIHQHQWDIVVSLWCGGVKVKLHGTLETFLRSMSTS